MPLTGERERICLFFPAVTPEKFLQFNWLEEEVFHRNMKYQYAVWRSPAYN